LQTDGYHKKLTISASEMSLPICKEWAVDHFDVNRSTFDEDMREKRFLHFRS